MSLARKSAGTTHHQGLVVEGGFNVVRLDAGQGHGSMESAVGFQHIGGLFSDLGTLRRRHGEETPLHPLGAFQRIAGFTPHSYRKIARQHCVFPGIYLYFLEI